MACIFIFTGCNQITPSSSSKQSQNQSKCTVLSAYIQKIKSQSGIDQIKTVFQCLDSRPDGLSTEENDPNYTYLIRTFENYLRTEASMKYDASDFKRFFSKNLALFQTPSKRVLQYVSDPFLYGEVNSGNFAILQQVENGKVNAATLYVSNTKHISHIFEESDNFLVVAGIDQMVNPYFAFIDGFSLSGGKAEYSPAVSDYTNSLWKITSDNGWVRGISEKNMGSSILSASASTITVQSNNQYKINLIYDKDKKKFLIDNTLSSK